MKKIFIIAGEHSGDLQASKLMAQMNLIEKIQWFGIGGDMMIANNLVCIKHMREMAFMGFWEVIIHLPEILRNFKLVKDKINKVSPDALILIDYPGFNLKIAKFAKQKKIKVIYYITPQLWAWHKSRVKLMKKYVDEIINVFPFEVDFYKQYGIKSHYFGHPITEGLQSKFNSKENFLNEINADQHREFIAVLPGSRISEVEKNMEILNEYIEQTPDHFFLIAKVNHIDTKHYQLIASNAKLVESYNYDLIRFCRFAIVASGTATLETACFEKPLIVIYKTNWLTFLIAKILVKLPYISLVNIIAENEIVPELIQSNLTSKNLSQKYRYLLDNEHSIIGKLKQVHLKLATEDVSETIAKFIVSRINII